MSQTPQNTEQEGCLICGAPLEYLEEEVEMECALCHRRENSRTRCRSGHYICNACHTSGLEGILALCRASDSRDPIALLEGMMSMPFCHMHGPEHHVMVGAALLTAYRNAGGALDLDRALGEMLARGREVPGGACGFWGCCGAGVSTGIYMSIATGATPLARESWGLSNQMTARALERIGGAGGPRCCKRDSYLAVLEAVRFTREKLGVSMEETHPTCSRSAHNQQCLAGRCPFHPK